MDKMKVIAGILIVIALFGLPCWVCGRKERMMGWLHSGISMRGPGVFLRIVPGMGLMG